MPSVLRHTGGRGCGLRSRGHHLRCPVSGLPHPSSVPDRTAAHTPGPWEVQTRQGVLRIVVQRQERQSAVAEDQQAEVWLGLQNTHPLPHGLGVPHRNGHSTVDVREGGGGVGVGGAGVHDRTDRLTRLKGGCEVSEGLATGTLRWGGGGGGMRRSL